MTQKREKSTRESLLSAAVAIFARRGYRAATVAQICKAARANIAAVNYHFGDKETLYREAWRDAFCRSLAKFAPDGGVRPDAPIEEHFYGRILALLRRFNDKKNYEFEIMQKEMSNPTGLLHEVLHESMEPLRRDFYDIVKHLLGPACDETQIAMCMMSVHSQCMEATIGARHRKSFAKAGGKFFCGHDKLPIEELAGHITKFSLAGIRDIRRAAEEK